MIIKISTRMTRPVDVIILLYSMVTSFSRFDMTVCSFNSPQILLMSGLKLVLRLIRPKNELCGRNLGKNLFIHAHRQEISGGFMTACL